MIKSTRKPSQPLKWHGGKHYLAKQIISLIPNHTHYVEPFFGGGAVLFQKPDELISEHSEVINDIYGDLMNFWEVVGCRNRFEEFRFKAELTPFSKPTWAKATAGESIEPVERALDFFVRFRQSRQGLGKDFATMSRSRTRRGMNEQISSWLSAIEGLDEAHARLQRVVVFSESAIDVISREDSPHTFFYCDPPYLQSTRTATTAYEEEMSEADHEQLLATLSAVSGKFILSGYPSGLYEEFAQSHGWGRKDIAIDNKASSKKVKPKKTECLWFNF